MQTRRFGPDQCTPTGRIAYVMTWFPKLTETFVLYEMLALQKRGVAVEVFPLLRRRQMPIHPEAIPLTERAHFQPFLSFRIVAAHWHYIRRKPLIYCRVLAEVLKGTAGSLRLFAGVLGLFPKTVLFAYEMEHINIKHVHAHFASNPAVAALIIHRLTGIPYSFTGHGSDVHVDATMLAEKVRWAAFAVAVSSYNKEVMVKACGEKLRHKIHVVHCGVDIDALQAKTSWTSNGPMEILCVASLGEVKGHKYLVEACRILAERGIDFKCRLVGQGRLRQTISKQVADAGLTNRFEIHDGLPRPDVVRLLRQADVFVLASVPTAQGKREGIPVALMEAMATAVPVVASDLSGIPELVEHLVCGLLVAPRDSAGLADAMQRYYDNPPLRKELGCSGRKTVMDRFNLDQNARKLIELFETVGQGKR